LAAKKAEAGSNCPGAGKPYLQRRLETFKTARQKTAQNNEER
jgi:hypothetical protein